MGGLSGGLYDLFDAVGEIFFTVLIGSKEPNVLNSRIQG